MHKSTTEPDDTNHAFQVKKSQGFTYDIKCLKDLTITVDNTEYHEAWKKNSRKV